MPQESYPQWNTIWIAVRRTGRRGLRMMRPLALPFLHRFQARVETAVRQTGVVDAVTALQASVQGLGSATTANRQHPYLPEIAQTKMAALRLEDAMATQERRLSLIHEALCSSVLSVEPRIAQLESESRELKSIIAGLKTQLERAYDHVVAKQGETRMLELLERILNRNIIPLTGTDAAVRTPHGYVVVPGTDLNLILYLAEGRGHELGTIKVLESLLDPGDTALDVGAHVGMMTLPMARRVGCTGSIRAIEPMGRTATCLRQTLALNGVASWTTVIEGAASDRSGPTRFYVSSNSALNSLLPLSNATEDLTVECVRLDDIVAPSEPVAVVKVDVEGAELAVLEGMSRLLKDNPDLIAVVEFDPGTISKAGTDAAQWMHRLEDAGLDTILQIDEQDGRCRRVSVEDLSAVRETVNLVAGRRSSSRLARVYGRP